MDSRNKQQHDQLTVFVPDCRRMVRMVYSCDKQVHKWSGLGDDLLHQFQLRDKSLSTADDI
jgi:hypothetical protein